MAEKVEDLLWQLTIPSVPTRPVAFWYVVLSGICPLFKRGWLGSDEKEAFGMFCSLRPTGTLNPKLEASA